MSNRIMFVQCAALAFLFGACAPSGEVLKPEGETAVFVTTDSVEHVGEFLFATDTSVVVMEERQMSADQLSGTRRIFDVPLSSIRSIKIRDFANRRWIVTLVGFQIVPTVLFGIVAASNTSGGNWGEFLLILGAPVALCYALLESGTPPDPFIGPPFDSMKDFSKYARYPEGLDQSQLGALLKTFGVTHIERLPQSPPKQKLPEEIGTDN